jgi:hypothetical protein
MSPRTNTPESGNQKPSTSTADTRPGYSRPAIAAVSRATAAVKACSGGVA